MLFYFICGQRGKKGTKGVVYKQLTDSRPSPVKIGNQPRKEGRLKRNDQTSKRQAHEPERSVKRVGAGVGDAERVGERRMVDGW